MRRCSMMWKNSDFSTRQKKDDGWHLFSAGAPGFITPFLCRFISAFMALIFSQSRQDWGKARRVSGKFKRQAVDTAVFDSKRVWFTKGT